MSLDFPASPSLNDEYKHPKTGTIYIWNGSQWILKFSATGNYNVPDATTLTKGILYLATDGDVNTGTNETKAVNPKQLKDALATVTGVANATTTVYGKTRLVDVADTDSNINVGAMVPGTEDDVVTLAALFARTPHASEAARGILPKASQAEVNAGSSAGGVVKAVTPETLAGRTGTDARDGIVRLAKLSEMSADDLAIPSGEELNVVTLQGFFSRLATAARAGIVQLANAQDLLDLASNRAVTPAQLMSNAAPAGAILPWPTEVSPSGWLECNGAPVSRTNYSRLFKALVTDAAIPGIAIAGMSWNTSGLFTAPAPHNLKRGYRLRFLSSGTIPDNCVADTDYYVITANAYAFYLTTDKYMQSNIVTGTAGVDCHYEASHWGLGDGTNTFNIPYILDFIRSKNGKPNTPFGMQGVGYFEDQSFLSHNHMLNYDYYTVTPNPLGTQLVNIIGPYNSVYTDSSGGTETKPKNVAMMFIIKY